MGFEAQPLRTERASMFSAFFTFAETANALRESYADA